MGEAYEALVSLRIEERQQKYETRGKRFVGNGSAVFLVFRISVVDLRSSVTAA
jgi:hypothetical protein